MLRKSANLRCGAIFFFPSAIGLSGKRREKVRNGVGHTSGPGTGRLSCWRFDSAHRRRFGRMSGHSDSLSLILGKRSTQRVIHKNELCRVRTFPDIFGHPRTSHFVFGFQRAPRTRMRARGARSYYPYVARCAFLNDGLRCEIVKVGAIFIAHRETSYVPVSFPFIAHRETSYVPVSFPLQKVKSKIPNV